VRGEARDGRYKPPHESEGRSAARRAVRIAHWHYQSIRLDHDDARMLKAIAKRRRTTVAELIRTYVTWGLEEDDSARRPDDL
jgi:predicted DNA-binding ribbon-helix-helix protein